MAEPVPATGIELLTPAEMAEADAAAAALGLPILLLMERAGAAVAKECRRFLRDLGAPSGPVVVLCGPGNNGGEGYVAARLLREEQVDVAVVPVGEGASSGAAGDAAARWVGPIMDGAALDLAGAVLVVDALFGAGLSRPLDGAAQRLVERIEASGIPVLAVDMPSGIDGADGAERGASLQADRTVTFFRGKPGHHLEPGLSRRGALTVVDIGIPPEVLTAIAPRIILNGPDLWRGVMPWPRSGGHKYSRGHAVVVSGSASHTGAARLSARAALRVGAGLVTLASPPDALAVNAAHLTAVMVHEADGPEGLAAILSDGRKNAVVLGPGLGVGAATRALVATALTMRPERADPDRPRAAVLDADALTSFTGGAAALAALVARSPGPVVVTPHDGEFARLFQQDPAVTGSASKLDNVRAAAARLGCIVLLKGPDTVIATPEGRIAITNAEAPWLATAGSGDVLSGLIGGLLAQSMPAFEAVTAGAWLHGAAARRFGPGLIAEDLPEMMPAVLAGVLDQPRTANQQRRPAKA